MKKIFYYIVLIALFVTCMVGMSFIMVGVEMVFNVKLGQTLKNFGFLVGISLFIAIKPFVKRYFTDKKK